MITNKTQTPIIQKILLLLFDFFSYSKGIGASDAEGPRPLFLEAPPGDGASAGDGTGAAKGGRMTVVLKGFPSFLHHIRIKRVHLNLSFPGH